MNGKKIIKKILTFASIFAFLFGATYFSVNFTKNNSVKFNNIILSLSIVDDDNEGGEGEGPEDGGDEGDVVGPPIVVDSNNKKTGSFIVKIKDLPIEDDKKRGEEDISDDNYISDEEIVTDFLDKENGISMSIQSNEPKSIILDIPTLPAFKFQDISVPSLPMEDVDVIITPKRVSFYGYAEPSSYVLLEIKSIPYFVTLFTDSDGKWRYTMPTDLSVGLHHIYVWNFSIDGKKKSLMSSMAFMVDNSLENEEYFDLFVESGVLKSSADNSYIISFLNKGVTNKEKGVLYLNGRVLDIDKNGNANVIIFADRLVGDIEQYVENLSFDYSIYDKNGVLIYKTSGDELPQLIGDKFVFVKTINLQDIKLSYNQEYKLLIETNFEDLHYVLPLTLNLDGSAYKWSFYSNMVMIVGISLMLSIIMYLAFQMKREKK